MSLIIMAPVLSRCSHLPIPCTAASKLPSQHLQFQNTRTKHPNHQLLVCPIYASFITATNKPCGNCRPASQKSTHSNIRTSHRKPTDISLPDTHNARHPQ
ncbi:hypothetical protein BO86DRAFT_169052 [Aspergillus japonicus CBS 114.51]|uniref:Uncharacterized protein n=1 Tax=Aspergillus japonicus CBS 114.51 TaxID=1448312 RepID=A0A8T8WT62_ASPJA|nr:hypothetical protein BO86DRAFT_169052 [Aspergillus japonicus CBS 114.51]RAH79028.1 hypothetical protein BO86DRAFT_169052 [Aspergillus japonicus CBS 114.51]